MHGPFTSASAANCAGPAVGTVATTVSANGSYTLPSLTVTTAGFFVWRVAVDGGPQPARHRVRRLPPRSEHSPAPSSWPQTAILSTQVQAQVSVNGVPGNNLVTVTTTLFGPYSSAAERDADNCGSFSEKVIQTRQGDGVLNSTPMTVDQSGYYAWQAETSLGRHLARLEVALPGPEHDHLCSVGRSALRMPTARSRTCSCSNPMPRPRTDRSHPDERQVRPSRHHVHRHVGQGA